MKTTFYFLFGFIILSLFTSSLAQENEKPFIVSPLIGDTLSLEERDYYNLLPAINGFQFAIFYLNSDSLLDVKVVYINRNEKKDTLITNYKSLENLRLQLLKTDIGKSRQVTAYVENNYSISGAFLSIGDDSVLIYSEDCEGRTLSSNCLIKIDNTRIKKLVIYGDSNVGNSVVSFTVIGGIVGGTFGALTSSGSFQALGAGAGLLVGLGAGLLTGLIYGSVTSEPDVVIQPFTEGNIKGLSQYSVFPYGEPDELKKIK